MLTRPLQTFRAMLANIRGDHFRPDESRTSRLVDIMKLSATATAVPEAQPADAPPAPILDQGDGVGSEAVPATPVANDAGYVQPAADGSAMQVRWPRLVQILHRIFRTMRIKLP